jgi:replicative DNA helicase
MADAPGAQTPPHSDEAEQSVLGAMLMDNAVVAEVSAILRADDFYYPDHARVFSAILALVNESKPADVITVYERTQGDLAFINALAQSVAGASAARAYAEIVRERSRRRALMRIGQQLADDAFRMTAEAAPVPGMVDAAVTALLAMVQRSGGAEPVDMPEILRDFIDDLQARADGRQLAFSTGLSDLDRLTGGGGRRGELWVIGARPSMGKTAFVLQLCRHVGVAQQVLMLTQEDSLLSSAARFVAAAGTVNLADLRNPQGAHQAMWGGVTSAIEELQTLTVTVDDQTGLTMADVRRKAQQVRQRHGRLDLVVVDYLQLMDDGGEVNRSVSLGYIANGLKRFAKEAKCWVVLLSQLNREADKRTGPPQMSDLRDSGDIEGAADLIGMLHRQYMRKPTVENKYFAELHVCKQKNGPTDTLRLFFDGAYQRFGNWDGPAPHAPGQRGD